MTKFEKCFDLYFKITEVAERKREERKGKYKGRKELEGGKKCISNLKKK